MNILVTLPSLDDPGGVAGHFRAVLPFLRAEDCRITLLQIGSTRSAAGILHPLCDPLRLLSILARRNIDLLHVNPSMNLRSFFRDGVFVFLAGMFGIPALVFFHGWDEAFANRVHHGLGWFFRRTYGSACAFIVLARDVERQLRDWRITAPVHLAATAIEDIPQHDVPAGIEPPHGPREDRVFRVLFLSRIVKEKGIFEAIDACALLSRSVPLRLTVAGDGPALEAARAHALRKLGAGVHFPGYVTGKAKRDVFRNSDVYLFPSYTEGMPVSVLEAMSMGLPVVTRRVGGLKDFFKDGEMGFITDSTAPETFARHLATLAGDKVLRARISRGNAEYARKNFSASAAAARLREIYSSCVSGTAAHAAPQPRTPYGTNGKERGK